MSVPIFMRCLFFAAGLACAQEVSVRIPVIADARSAAPADWRYMTEDPAAENWADTGYDDSNWPAGTAGFGTGTVEKGHINSDWSTGSIWLRKSFNLPDLDVRAIVLALHHDEDVEVYLNGQQVYQESGWLTDYNEFYLADEYNSALHGGRNVIAIVCRNTDGAGYIDAGLSVDYDLNATPLVSDARAFPTEWSFVTADPGQDWYQPGFDASSWLTGRGGFGSGDIYPFTTAWQESDIWMRTEFKADVLSSMYQLSYMHDDDLEVYLNGTLVAQKSGFTAGYEDEMSDAVAQAIKLGTNTLAVHCANSGTGPQFVDVGLRGLDKVVTSAASHKAVPVASSGKGPLLTARSAGVDVAALAKGVPGRLILYSLDGHVRAGGSSAGYLPLPVTLGTGMFRYLWRSPRGTLRGTLLKLD